MLCLGMRARVSEEGGQDWCKFVSGYRAMSDPLKLGSMGSGPVPLTGSGGDLRGDPGVPQDGPRLDPVSAPYPGRGGRIYPMELHTQISS